jgi:hypothetical protein
MKFLIKNPLYKGVGWESLFFLRISLKSQDKLYIRIGRKWDYTYYR